MAKYKQAMWIHGHSLHVEYPDRVKSIARAGFLVQIVGKKDTLNWFHFSIPTSVIVKDKRQMIDSVMLRFKTGHANTAVTNVHIYDGERKIASHDGLNISFNNFNSRRFDVPGKTDISWGVGISVCVKFKGTSDAQNTIAFSSAGCDFDLFETVRVHFKVLEQPSVSLDTMLSSMREVFEPNGFRVIQVGTENINRPDLNDIDAGKCILGVTTDEQKDLFGHRNNVGNNEIVAYFVRSTNPPYAGCAAHPAGRPGCIVAKGATKWTLAHEIGHVLGLFHVNDNNRLMTGNGTYNITNPPPDLSSDEIKTMSKSPLTINP